MTQIKLGMAIAFVALTATSSFATEAQISETDQGVVVEYTGVPEERKPDPVPESAPAAKAPDPHPPIEATPQDKTKVVPRSLDEIIRVTNFTVIPATRSYGSTTVSAKFDIANEGPAGSILVDIIGEAGSGHELTRILFTQRIGAGESRTFTTTRTLSDDLFSRVARWRMDDIRMSYPRN